MLEIRNLCGGYSRREVLHDISFTAAPGQVTVIIGPNGCGKSTLLKTICGIQPATAGNVQLKDQELLTLPHNLLAQMVAYLPQNRQTPDITVERLVLHGRFPYLSYPRRYRQKDYQIARKAMEQMNLLEFAQMPMSCLSGGQQQRVYIAMAIAQGAPVILLDEPTTYLDIAHQLQLMQIARSMAQKGKVVLLVIHDLPCAFEIADKLVLMNDGFVVVEGTGEKLYTSGKIESVFGIRLNRIRTDNGWRYFCEERSV